MNESPKGPGQGDWTEDEPRIPISESEMLAFFLEGKEIDFYKRFFVLGAPLVGAMRTYLNTENGQPREEKLDYIFAVMKEVFPPFDYQTYKPAQNALAFIREIGITGKEAQQMERRSSLGKMKKWFENIMASTKMFPDELKKTHPEGFDIKDELTRFNMILSMRGLLLEDLGVTEEEYEKLAKWVPQKPELN